MTLTHGDVDDVGEVSKTGVPLGLGRGDTATPAARASVRHEAQPPDDDRAMRSILLALARLRSSASAVLPISLDEWPDDIPAFVDELHATSDETARMKEWAHRSTIDYRMHRSPGQGKCTRVGDGALRSYLLQNPAEQGGKAAMLKALDSNGGQPDLQCGQQRAAAPSTRRSLAVNQQARGMEINKSGNERNGHILASRT